MAGWHPVSHCDLLDGVKIVVSHSSRISHLRYSLGPRSTPAFLTTCPESHCLSIAIMQGLAFNLPGDISASQGFRWRGAQLGIQLHLSLEGT